MQDLMTIKETASYLRLNYSTLYKLAQKGKIPVSKVGGTWRFKKQILDDWLIGQRLQAREAVLIVDDDARVRELIRDITVGQGCEVITAEDGEKAIREIEKRHFDLMFLDLVLPGLSGIEVLERLKAKGEKTVVAIVTAYGDDPIALQAMSLGPLVLIRKPFTVQDIQLVLSFVAGRQPAKQHSSGNNGLGVVKT